MAAQSAGLMMFRVRFGALEVLLVHPGGPFWVKRDLGAWTIPKGEAAPGEDLLVTAQREFQEETGISPIGPFIPLGLVKQRGGKTVHAWGFEGDCDAASIRSNTFELEWPPKSGKCIVVPEVDKAEWFGIDEAKQKINKAQCELLDALAREIPPGI